MKFSIIVAADESFGIGNKGEMPWSLPGDLKHFKKITEKVYQRNGKRNAVIMGRKTWESLPEQYKPLPNRNNIVVSHTLQGREDDKYLVVDSLECALHIAGQTSNSIFVIGGGEIFWQALQTEGLDKVYLTHIQEKFTCDTFFPFLASNFNLLELSEVFMENNTTYHFAEYEIKRR